MGEAVSRGLESFSSVLFAWTPLTNNSQCTSSHHIVTMAAIFEQYRQALEKFLYQDGPLKPYIEKVEAKTGVKRIYLAIGLTVLLSLYLVFGYGAQLLCNLIGFVYPALKSIKAVESVKKEDDTKWLTYWIVFAFLSTLEFFSNLITNFIPFYWLLKCMVLIWCFAPLGAWNGSSMIYNRLILPMYQRNQTRLEAAMKEASDHAGKLAEKAQQMAADTMFKSD